MIGTSQGYGRWSIYRRINPRWSDGQLARRIATFSEEDPSVVVLTEGWALFIAVTGRNSLNYLVRVPKRGSFGR